MEGPAVEGGSLFHTLHHSQASSPGQFIQNLWVENLYYLIILREKENMKKDIKEKNLVVDEYERTEKQPIWFCPLYFFNLLTHPT